MMNVKLRISEMIIRITLAVTNKHQRKMLADQLEAPDMAISTIQSSGKMWPKLLNQSGDVVILSQDILPEPIESSIAMLNDLPESPTTVVLTPHDSPQTQAFLLGHGCDTVLYDGLSDDYLVQAIEASLEARRQLASRGIHQLDMPLDKPQLSDFISKSPSMQLFMQTVKRIVNCSSSLLILGETGVGKERLARAIHSEGPRSQGAFIAVNCAALPESLLESELFGHEQGAFTGATRARKGAFELAHGGTIFLDEIGEMPLHLQSKLLRVLQDYEIRRIGGENTFAVDIRVIAASNKDLNREIEKNTFRQDLFFRLSVVPLTIPPLRERQEDIPELVRSNLEFLRTRIAREVRYISDEAVDVLSKYDWPGNVRELINVLERAILLCESDTITLVDLPLSIQQLNDHVNLIAEDGNFCPDNWVGKTLREVRDPLVAKVEQAYIANILQKTQGRIGEAAGIAGLNPRALYDKMKKFGLDKKYYKSKSANK